MKRKKLKIVGILITSSLILLPLQKLFCFEMAGFANINYWASGSKAANQNLKKGSFILGQVDYFAAHAITDNMDVLSEIVFEAPKDAMLVDVERLEIGYAFDDWLNFRAGRFHTPLGYYANVYHHGRHLDSTIDRPLILEFEDGGGLIPGHIVGLWARGDLKTEPGTLNYSLAIANGQKLNVTDKELTLNMASDDNNDKANIANLTFEPAILKGLGIGGSIYRAKVYGYAAGVTSPTVDVDQLITGVNVYYDELPVQFMAEYYNIKNRDLLAQPAYIYTSQGYFLQAAYEFKGKVRPYARFEQVLPELGDPYSTALVEKGITRFTCGFKYNIAPESSVKIEAMSQNQAGDQADSFGLQWSFQF